MYYWYIYPCRQGSRSIILLPVFNYPMKPFFHCIFSMIPGRAFLLLLLAFLLTGRESYAQVTCNASGTWSTAGWTPAAPVAGDNITVAAGCTLTVDILAPVVNNLTINGVIIISNSASSYLTVSGNITVNNGAKLENNGSIEFTTLGNTFSLLGTATYIHNPRNNTLLDESIFYNSTETFSTTSNLIIQKWNDGSIPLGDVSRVGSSLFGNVTLSAVPPGGVWDQDGKFSTNRIRGAFTVGAGTVVMDDGTGGATSLILQDVVINGTGNIVFQRGYGRNLSLQTNNFTVNSVAPALPTVVMDTSFGVLTMTVNGNMTLNYGFNAVYSGTWQNGANVRINVNGNLNITGGNIDFLNKADAPLQLTVTGTTTLNNTTGPVWFIEGGSGNLTFSTYDLVISGGSSNYFQGTPGATNPAKGLATITVINDFSVTGTSNTFMAFSDSLVQKVRITVGRDMIMSGTNSVLTCAYSNGPFTLSVTRNYNQTNGQLTGQAYQNNALVDSIIFGSSFTFNSATASAFFKGNRGQGTTIIRTTGNFTLLNSGTGYSQGFMGIDSSAAPLTFNVTGNLIQNGGQFSAIYNGSGLLNFSVAGVLDVNGGIFKACNNTLYSNAGSLSFTVGSIDYDGGNFSAFYSCNNTAATGTITVNGVCKINFGVAADSFSFIGSGKVGFDINNLNLILSITGAMTIQGANGTFISSQAGGTETISLLSLNISSGTNSFNSVQSSTLGNGHMVTMVLTGDLIVTGGNTFLSARTQAATININGNLSLSNGTLSLKGADATNPVTLNINGSYSQTGGNFYFHNNVNDTLNTSATITVNVNADDNASGDFTHTGGMIYFDNCVGSPPSLALVLNVKSPNYTLGGTGQMTMTNPGTGNVFGTLNFCRTGTTSFTRSGSHDIQQIRQNILTGTTVDVVSGDLQLCSHNTVSALPDFLLISVGGILDLRTNHVFSNAVKPHSGLTNLGRIRTANVNGFYNGTVTGAVKTNGSDNMDFFLSSSSYVEYNGVDNQIVTGIGTGIALLSQHKYGKLDINFGGTPDVEFVYPTNLPNDSSVYVRSELISTSGEFNLDDDHNPSNGGGRMVTIESTSAAATSRTSGYIRSETEDNSGLIKWKINAGVGNHVFHFGYNSANYIPFTFAAGSGNAGNVYVGTYHTDPANLPYPPTVTHMRNNGGTDNSANTVDRFWYVDTKDSALTANLTFVCTPAELGSITAPLAQRWVVAPQSWTNPVPGTQTSMVSGTQANAIGATNDWWTLAGSNNLLPVDLIAFSGHCSGEVIKLNWTTATEINNDHFVIERSLDGTGFENIGQVTGSGNSSQPLEYAFSDHNIFNRTVFYRLLQVDYDGKTTYYGPITVSSCRDEDTFDAGIALSNSTGRTLIVLTGENGNGTLELISLSGSVLKKWNASLIRGTNRFPLENLGLAEGIYFVTISQHGNSVTRKFVYTVN